MLKVFLRCEASGILFFLMVSFSFYFLFCVKVTYLQYRNKRFVSDFVINFIIILDIKELETGSNIEAPLQTTQQSEKQYTPCGNKEVVEKSKEGSGR